MTGSRLLPAAVLCALSLSLPGASVAEVPAAGRPPQLRVDPDTIRETFNRVVPIEVERQHVPGVVVAVVHGCETRFSNGWGLADIATRTPMNPAATYFRLGSISKVLTATVAMSLAERGVLDLNEDLESYLPADYLQLEYAPITMINVLTHTSGLGERWSDLAANSKSGVLPLERYFADYPPLQVARPGTVKVYNSTAFALAALVMERASGTSFAQLSRDVLFRPAGMKHVTWMPNEDQEPNLATGYRFGEGTFEEVAGDVFYHIFPGADAIATSTDMTQFLKVHLGCASGGDVLPEAGLLQMHRTHFTHHPAVPGMALGFEELRMNGRRWLKKAGGAPGVTTFVAFLPGSGLGVFVGVNADQHPFWRSIMTGLAEVLPKADEAPPFNGTERNLPASQYAGWYRSLRLSMGNYLKIASLLQHHVEAVDADSLSYRGATYHAVGDHLFQETATQRILGFRVGQNGRPLFMFINGSDGYERTAWWETLPAQLLLFVFFSATFAAGLVCSLLRAVQLYKRRLAIGPLTWLCALTAFLNVLLIAGWGIFFSTFDVWMAQVGVPPAIHALLALPLLSLGTVCAIVWLALQRPQSAQLGLYDRALIAAMTLAAVAFLPLLSYWNLVAIPV